MKAKLSPTLVGAFVLGALALAIFGLISFGSARLFSKPGRFVAYFNESVQGLDLGSAVKLRGVRVGRVAGIKIQYDPKTRKSKVAVLCELEHNLIADPQGNIIKLTDANALIGLVHDGMRAKLRLTGITGLQVIELDFADPKQTTLPVGRDEDGNTVMPTLPSQFTELAESASEVLARLRKVDLDGLTRDVRTLVTNANAKLTQLDLESAVAKISAAAGALESLAGGAETRAVLTNLNQTLGQMRTLAGRLDTQATSLGEEARLSLRTFNRAAEAVEKTLGPESGLREETTRTLRKLHEAAASVERLADYLERNPNAVLTGKNPPQK